jgi:hypothetical protein
MLIGCLARGLLGIYVAGAGANAHRIVLHSLHSPQLHAEAEMRESSAAGGIPHCADDSAWQM